MECLWSQCLYVLLQSSACSWGSQIKRFGVKPKEKPVGDFAACFLKRWEELHHEDVSFSNEECENAIEDDGSENCNCN